MLTRSKTYRPNWWLRLFIGDDWKLILNESNPQHVSLNDIDLISIDITAIKIIPRLFCYRLEIYTSGSIATLDGLSKKSAHELRNAVYILINKHFADIIDQNKGKLQDVNEALDHIIHTKSQYLSHSDIRRFTAKLPTEAIQTLCHPLFEMASMPVKLRPYLPSSLDLLTNNEERQKYNEAFVRHEMFAYKSFFDQLSGLSLSDEQRLACIRLEDSNLLIASAGSGKSATMVSKVAYVVEKQIHPPSEILVLAFNKNAANELKERISKQLNIANTDLKCRVTTFHALGLDIIKEIEGRPPQLANWVNKGEGEARFINGIIEELINADEEFSKLWLDLLLLYPKADIPATQFETLENYQQYIADNTGKRSDGTLSQSGDYVESLQELTIANWLWQHSVNFEYERQTKVFDADNSVRFVKPDFYYPDTSTIHEHFAINANGTSPFDNYVEHAQLKREGYARINSDFFETTSANSSDGSLTSRLQFELEKRGILLVPRPPQEILKSIPPIVVTRFSKIVSLCIKHIRSSGLTLEMLVEKAQSLHDTERGTRFAKAVWLITQAYSNKLDQEKRIDFDSMIGDATKLVESGQYKNPYSLILVDEFQDISESRAKLIQALLNAKEYTKLFAVGDDWQSIYRFTGSDISIFTDFETHFGTSWQGRLQRTYRSNQTLADTAARFIQKNPSQLTKQVTSSRPAIPRSIRAIPIDVDRAKQKISDACFKLLERLDNFLEGNKQLWHHEEKKRLKVLVLWRYNNLNPFNSRTPKFENINVLGYSFHKSKGLEAEYTILLDVSEGDYGVPSRIEDDELLNLVIPRPEKYEYAEERRLFYVALTRASRGTFLLYNRSKPSRYIAELCGIAGDDVQFETIDGARLSQCPKCITGRLQQNANDEIGILRCSSQPRCLHTQQAA